MNRKFAFVLVFVLLGSAAMAQTTMTKPQVSTSQTEAAAGSLSMPVTPKRPTWQTHLSTENTLTGADRINYGSNAPVVSMNAVGLVYNVNPTLALEIRQYFEYASNKENLSAGRTLQTHQNSMEAGPVALRIAGKPLSGIFGSKPGSWAIRYDLPTDRLARNNKELGYLRADALNEWMLNPKVSISSYVSPRVRFNSTLNPNTAKGSDAEAYVLIAGPAANYYFSDNVSTYYSYSVDLRSTQAQRGTWTPDANNTNSHELGAYVSVGPVLINPAVGSDTDLNSGAASLFTANSRVFSAETLSYYLNVSARF